MLQCQPCCIYQMLYLYYYYSMSAIMCTICTTMKRYSGHSVCTTQVIIQKNEFKKNKQKKQTMTIIVYQWYLLMCQMFPLSLVACATFRLIALHEKSWYSTVQTSTFFGLSYHARCT